MTIIFIKSIFFLNNTCYDIYCKHVLKGALKMLKKLSVVFLFIFALGLIGCSNEDDKGVNYPKEYNIVDVISGEETDDGVVMVLETDGFGGTIQAEVTVKDGVITAFEVKDHSESEGWGQTVIDDSGIIQGLIDDSDDLDNFDLNTYLDSSASATVTAEALLEIAKAAIEHYEEDYQ
jgi:Na+-translocating ferredoxin:NAD+ oxidoreductase RnfG subunit